MSTASKNPPPATRRAIHPPLTDVPVGALVVAAVFDVISTAGGDTHAWARDLFRAGTFTGKLVYRRGVGVAPVSPTAGEIPAAADSPAVPDTRQGASGAR